MTIAPSIIRPMADTALVWCCIPVYNNAGSILDVARRCRAQWPRVVVVDDGSTDADLRELLKTVDVQVIRHEVNRGKGAALLTGFDFARRQGGKFVISLDGDGQHFPEDIPQILPFVDSDVVVIGYRNQTIGLRPKASFFGQAFSDFWVQAESGAAVRDSQSGFRCYPLEVLAGLRLRSRHYNFEVEILVRAIWAGCRTAAAPVRVIYSEEARRGSSFRRFRDNLRLTLLHTRLVLRQLLPVRHRRWAHRSEGTGNVGGFWRQNAAPVGLAAATATGFFLSVVLWPFGALVAIYVAWRLHLNKVAMLAGAIVASLPWGFPAAGVWIGSELVPASHPHWSWFVGSHVVAFVVTPVAVWLVYLVAARSQRMQATSEDA